MTTKKRYFSILLSLVLMLGMLPGLCLTAKAATPTTLTSTSTSWNEDSTISDDTEINSGVTITDDITLTIPKNKTLTVIGGIDADGKTLTVTGKGRLIVSGDDAQGGDGLKGNIIVKGANVTVTGGNGSQGTAGSTGAPGSWGELYGGGGGNGGTGDNGGNGGSGVAGNVTVTSGSIIVTGGNGGQGGTGGNGGVGGSSEETGGFGGQGGTGGNGGDGGSGVAGNVTVNSGLITVTGGNGGQGGNGGNGGRGGFGQEENNYAATGGTGSAGTAGSEAQAVGGTITGSAKESGDNSNWTAVSNGSSTKQYLMVTPSHTHSFTYSANSATATITATCSADGCPLPLSTEGGNDHVATLTIGKPTLETYGQTGTDISAEATIIDEKSIMGDAEVLYQTKNNGSYGTATATTSPARRQRRLPPSSSEPADTRTQPTETAT